MIAGSKRVCRAVEKARQTIHKHIVMKTQYKCMKLIRRSTDRELIDAEFLSLRELVYEQLTPEDYEKYEESI